MSNLPSQELLEATHTFPGRFVFKAIGKGHEPFIAEVVTVVRRELAVEFDPPYETNYSSGGRHVSVTLTPHVESADQVLAIYGAIQRVEGLVMLM